VTHNKNVLPSDGDHATNKEGKQWLKVCWKLRD
jgi:hypothetical protein